MSGGSTHARREHRSWKINIYSNECMEHFKHRRVHTHAAQKREKNYSCTRFGTLEIPV